MKQMRLSADKRKDFDIDPVHNSSSSFHTAGVVNSYIKTATHIGRLHHKEDFSENSTKKENNDSIKSSDQKYNIFADKKPDFVVPSF